MSTSWCVLHVRQKISLESWTYKPYHYLLFPSSGSSGSSDETSLSEFMKQLSSEEEPPCGGDERLVPLSHKHFLPTCLQRSAHRLMDATNQRQKARYQSNALAEFFFIATDTWTRERASGYAKQRFHRETNVSSKSTASLNTRGLQP